MLRSNQLKKVNLTVLGLIVCLVIWPLFATSIVVDNNIVKLSCVFGTTLLVTAGFLCSLLGLKKAVFTTQHILYILLGGIGLLIHSFQYIYFFMFGLAVIGSFSISLGFITFILIVIAPTVIAIRIAFLDLSTLLDKGSTKRNKSKT